MSDLLSSSHSCHILRLIPLHRAFEQMLFIAAQVAFAADLKCQVTKMHLFSFMS